MVHFSEHSLFTKIVETQAGMEAYGDLTWDTYTAKQWVLHCAESFSKWVQVPKEIVEQNPRAFWVGLRDDENESYSVSGRCNGLRVYALMTKSVDTNTEYFILQDCVVSMELNSNNELTDTIAAIELMIAAEKEI